MKWGVLVLAVRAEGGMAARERQNSNRSQISKPVLEKQSDLTVYFYSDNLSLLFCVQQALFGGCRQV
jgi:hypothetical protein